MYKQINKEVIMKSGKDIGTSAEAIREEPLVLKPEWETKPKKVEKIHMFSLTFDEGEQKLVLTVNGDKYREHPVKDKLSGTMKFHEGVDQMVKLFRDWGFYKVY